MWSNQVCSTSLKAFYSQIRRIISTRSELSKQQDYSQELTAVWEADIAGLAVECTAALSARDLQTITTCLLLDAACKRCIS